MLPKSCISWGDLFNKHPLRPAPALSVTARSVKREAGAALGVQRCKAAGRRQQHCVSELVRCFHKVKANTEIWVSEVEACFAE